MYHYHDSTPEPSHWLEQVYATNNALDDGFNVRSWPYGQLHTGLRSPLGERFATSQQSSFHAQSVASAWDNALGTRQLESPLGTLTSSRTSRITSSAAAACPSVPTTVEAPPYRLHSHQPHWQSPTQHRTHTISAQQPGHAASDSSLPSQSQGTFPDINQHNSFLLDPFSVDALGRHTSLPSSFAPVQLQSHCAGMSPLAAGRQSLLLEDSCSFPAPFPEFSFNPSKPDCPQMSSAAILECTEANTHCTAPHSYMHSKSEPAETWLRSSSEKSERQVLESDLQSAAEKLLDDPDIISSEIDGSNSDEQAARKCMPRSGRKKTKIDHITVAYLEEHKCFDMPLVEAAKSLDVGLSVMKRVCRTLGLARWPYRTRASLQNVIEKTERYLVDHAETEDGEAASGQKANVIEALQTQMSSVTGRGGSDLNSAIKKYRQSIFKLNYKLKKCKSTPLARHKIAVPRNAAERVLQDHF